VIIVTVISPIKVIMKQQVALLAVHCMLSNTRYTGQLSVGDLMNFGSCSEQVLN